MFGYMIRFEPLKLRAEQLLCTHATAASKVASYYTHALKEGAAETLRLALDGVLAHVGRAYVCDCLIECLSRPAYFPSAQRERIVLR